MEEVKKVLIVDDEEHMRALLKYNLSKENYDIRTANDGEQALEEVKKQIPDLIISDVMMPRMDGYEFCMTLREDPKTKTIPFIFLTAKGQLPDKIAGLKKGADDYLTKPFVPKELVEMVNARLKRVQVYKEMADTDALTGLYNKRSLLEHIHAEMIRAKRMGILLCIGFIDIDFFRTINNRYGHSVGDEVLISVSGAIRKSIQKEDFAGRYGGEEFMVIYVAKTVEQAAVDLEELRKNIEQLSFAQPDLKVMVSIGVSCFPDDGGDLKELVSKADQAMYQAKHTGMNRVVTYSNMKGASGGAT